MDEPIMTGKQGLEWWQQQEPGVYTLHRRHWTESKPEVSPGFSSQIRPVMYFLQQGTTEASPNSTTDWIQSVQTSEPMRGIFIPTTVICVFGVFPIPCLELCTAADMVVWVRLVPIISWGVTQLGGVALLEWVWPCWRNVPL